MIMPDRIDLINYAIAVSGITISLLGVILALRIQYMDKAAKRFFILLFTILIIYTTSDLASHISLVFMREPEFALLSKAAIFIESFSSSVLMPMLTVYMLRLCNESLMTPLFRIVSVLWGIYTVLLIVTQFTTFIYYITDENEYFRGPLYPLLLVPTVLLMLCNIIGLFRRRKKLTRKELFAFSIYLIIPVISMLIQMISYSIRFIVLGTSLSSLILFVFILDSQSSRVAKQKIEMGEQELRIRTLQMRPHFIYNTMTNIYYLCELDPKKAQKVVDDFTTYLRNNFSSVVKQGLIPFTDELKHTKAFLAVVKARYEDHLFVEYDTPYTSFHLPPLTLEPIVENAVKHGLDLEAEPLNIRIRTRQTDDGAEITVENSGAKLTLEDLNHVGFDDEDNESHIGLSNVSDRLNSLCGGTITISPGEKGGAIVVMQIPAHVRQENP